ncbi:MAG: hypothetical protein ACRD6I_07515, partial [Candidatus Acidiferrales bacterium]
MARSAEELLEFPRLREIVRGYTTCAPGRAHVDGLAPGQDRVALEAVFALIGEAVAYLRAGHELGFGALADPAAWLPRLEVRGSVLAPGEILDAASLLETTAWLKQVFRASGAGAAAKEVDAAKFPRLAARAAA